MNTRKYNDTERRTRHLEAQKRYNKRIFEERNSTAALQHAMAIERMLSKAPEEERVALLHRYLLENITKF